MSTLGLTAEDIHADAKAALHGGRQRTKGVDAEGTNISSAYGRSSVAISTRIFASSTAYSDMGVGCESVISEPALSKEKEGRTRHNSDYGYELGIRSDRSSPDVWK